MIYRIAETGKYMMVTMRTWDHDHWSPDFFYDQEVDVPTNYPQEDGGYAYILTTEQFQKMVDFWEFECLCMRTGQIGEMTYGDAYDPSDTYLFVNEVCV